MKHKIDYRTNFSERLFFSFLLFYPFHLFLVVPTQVALYFEVVSFFESFTEHSCMLFCSLYMLVLFFFFFWRCDSLHQVQKSFSESKYEIEWIEPHPVPSFAKPKPIWLIIMLSTLFLSSHLVTSLVPELIHILLVF